MWQKFSMRQRVICTIIAVCTALVYLLFCLYAIGGVWQRKEGDLPPVPLWPEEASLFLVFFPFGFVPGFRDILLVPVLNALLWGAVAGASYVFLVVLKSRSKSSGASQ
jgi:hypothetical protein